MSIEYTYETAPIEFKIRNRVSGGEGSTLKLIMNDVKRDIVFNDTMSLSFATVNPILLKASESDITYPIENPGYYLIENENEVICDGHVYKIKQITDRGDYKRLSCVHEFSELSKVQRYKYIEGETTIGDVVDYLFAGTGWTVNVSSDIRNVPLTLPKEKFGVGSILKNLKELLKRMPLEFNLLPNKTIYLSFGVGGTERATYEYGVNIQSLSTESDSTDLYTRIRGYYMNVTGQDEEGNDIEEWAHVEVINEQMELEYGVLEMDSLWESGIKSAAEMEYACWIKLYSAVKYNIDLTSTDFEIKQIGQYVQVTHPKIDTSKFATSARIFSISEGLINNELKPIEATIGNYSFSYSEEIVNDRLDELEKEVRNLKNRTNNFMLSRFMIGNKNALAIPGAILGKNTTLPADITAVIEYEELEELTGIFLTKKTAYKDYYLEIKTYNSAAAVTGTYNYEESKTILESSKFPNGNVVAISVTVTQVPPEEFNEQTHRKQILGVKFIGSANGNAGEYLQEFSVGDTDFLPTASDETAQVIQYVKGNITEVIASFSHVTQEKLIGLFAQLKEEYADYHLTVMDHSNGAFQVVDYSSEMQSWKYPNSEDDTRSIVLIITEEPYSSLNAGNIDNEFMVAYGLNFEHGDPLKEEKLYMEFGTAPLANRMIISFQKGPYDDVRSITTGITSDGEMNPVTISVKTITDGNGKYVSLEAYAKDVTTEATVNFHAVCMKMEIAQKDKV